MKSIFLFLLALAACRAVFSQQSLMMQKEFKDPPVSARPKALWPWPNGNVSLPQVTFELEEAKRKGMGGFDIWDIGTQIDPDSSIPAGPAFLSPPSLQAINYAIKEADRLGLELGLTFSSSWNAGGSWIKPEHGAMGIFRNDTIVEGPQNFSATIRFPVIPDVRPVFYKEVALIAHRVEKDSLIGSVDETVIISGKPGEKISWQVPGGKWRITRYVCAPTGQSLAIPSPNSKGLMLDHFSADAQRYNLNYIFNKLIPVTGSLKNRSLKYLYADSYEVNSGVWTPALPEEFHKRNNYRLEKFLPVLDGFIVESKEKTERFLFDFRKTLSDLIIDNHYRLGTQLCKEQGIGFCAEAGGPGAPIHNVPYEDLKALGSLTIPRGEFWNKHPQLELLQIIKGIASASHIYDQKFVEAESFTSVWLWQEGPDELKPLADRAMCEGLNRFVYHTFPHTPPESGFPGWVYNFGTLINTTNGWWPKSEGFHNYIARCSYLLQQGNFVGDVAFYYGDKAPNFVAPKHVDSSLGFGYDYDVVNTEAILSRMKVKDGRIYLPHGQFYEVLVLPHERRMNPDVLRKIEQMVAEGATVIGPKPSVSYGLHEYEKNDKIISDLADRLWGNCDSINVTEHRYKKGKIVWGKSIRSVLLGKKILQDISVKNSLVDFIHRRANGAEIYFIRNTKKEPLADILTFRVKDMQPEYWNAETGEIIQINSFGQSDNGTEIPVTLSANGSCIIVFRQGASKNQKQTEENIRIIDSINIDGPWILNFEQQKSGIASDTMQQLAPLNHSSKDAVKYYSGTTLYKTSFVLRPGQLKNMQKLTLDLGRVKEIAEVYLNGNRIGNSWHSPYQLDITNAATEGENYLQVEVVNTINNRLIGDARLPKNVRRMKSNIARLPNAWMKPFAEATLLDAGLIGPVKIYFSGARR